MSIILYCLFYMFLGAFWVLSLLRALHMFQLNDYSVRLSTGFFKRHPSEFVPGLLASCASLLQVPLIYNALGISRNLRYLLGDIILILLVAWMIARVGAKAKKPLVMTHRARRLLIVSLLIVFVPAVLTFIFIGSSNRHAFVLAGLSLLIALVIILAGWILWPFEKLNNLRFINEAKKIIASDPSLKVIAVTGSYGKTSVKTMLGELMSAGYNTLITPASFNTVLGVTRTIREKLRARHEVFVCEIGARFQGDVRKTAEIVSPKYAMITSIGPQHLETMKTLDNIKATKFELADILPDDGVLFYNAEDQNILSYISHAHTRTVSYGLHEGLDFFASDISASENGCTFNVHFPDGAVHAFTTSLIGAHAVINIVGAIAVASEFGIPAERLSARVKNLKGAEHRLELIRHGKLLILDDSYNSNPSGSRAALDALNLFEGEKVLITPGMVELGHAGREANRAFGEQASSVCDRVYLIGDTNTADIYQGLLDGGFAASSIRLADTPQAAMNELLMEPTLASKRIVLLENDLPDNY